MAANDYHVVVYQILAYLYNCLKDGLDVNLHSIEKFKEENDINERYWQYILKHLYESGLVEGLAPVMMIGGQGVKCTAEFAITPLGIDYLAENSNMQKAKQAVLKALKTAAPSIIDNIF